MTLQESLIKRGLIINNPTPKPLPVIVKEEVKKK